MGKRGWREVGKSAEGRLGVSIGGTARESKGAKQYTWESEVGGR
jgi:hypothetical protein